MQRRPARRRAGRSAGPACKRYGGGSPLGAGKAMSSAGRLRAPLPATTVQRYTLPGGGRRGRSAALRSASRPIRGQGLAPDRSAGPPSTGWDRSGNGSRRCPAPEGRWAARTWSSVRTRSICSVTIILRSIPGPRATGSLLVGFTPSLQAHVSLDKTEDWALKPESATIGWNPPRSPHSGAPATEASRQCGPRVWFPPRGARTERGLPGEARPGLPPP